MTSVVTSWKAYESEPPSPESLTKYFIEPSAQKFAWFLSKGYSPHLWQTIFHGMQYDGKLTRFRNLVAGRRGGKTLSAAWEVLFYLQHPEIFHWDAHRTESDKP